MLLVQGKVKNRGKSAFSREFDYELGVKPGIFAMKSTKKWDPRSDERRAITHSRTRNYG